MLKTTKMMTDAAVFSEIRAKIGKMRETAWQGSFYGIKRHSHGKGCVDAMAWDLCQRTAYTHIFARSMMQTARIARSKADHVSHFARRCGNE